MNDQAPDPDRTTHEETDRLPLRGAAIIVAVGVLLGLAANWAAADAERLPWIADDPVEALPTLGHAAPPTTGEAVEPIEAPAGTTNRYATDVDDPMAVPAGAADTLGLPEIPDLGRPIQIELAALKSFFDAGAVLVVDARDPGEFAEGHIAGSVNLPYDRAASDPALLEQLDTGGRPIVTYCGGGQCELSLSLAYELIAAGHPKVLVFMGGFPEWEQAGFAIDRGAAG